MKLRIFFVLLTITSVAFGQGTVVDDSFFSAALNEEQMVDVYLPAGYDAENTDHRYPVVYFLHGGTFNQNSHADMIPVLNEIIGSEIEPVIVVKPNGFYGPYMGMSWFANSELNGMWEDYVVQDLVEYIDTNYNTKSQQKFRCVMGFSMGGYSAMMIALKHPDIFNGVAIHTGLVNFMLNLEENTQTILNENGGSGPFDPDAGAYTESMFSKAAAFSPNLDNPPYYLDLPIENDGTPIDEVLNRWLPHDCAHLATELDPDDSLAIYMDCGTLDVGFINVNNSFSDTLDLYQIPHRYDLFTGGHMSALPSRYPISYGFLDSVMFHDVAMAEHVEADPTYVSPGESVLITATVTNPRNSNLNVFANISQSGVVSEITVDLYNDGTHGDLEAGDGTWSYEWITTEAEYDVYFVDIEVEDADNEWSYLSDNAAAFTTAGPVVFESVNVITQNPPPSPGDELFCQITLNHSGSIVPIDDVSATVSLTNDLLSFGGSPTVEFGDLEPGSSVMASSILFLNVNTLCPQNILIPLEIDIESNGLPLWHDEFSIQIGEASGVKNLYYQTIPEKFDLSSSYPNPFNPSTSFEVKLPENSDLTVRIINSLGQEVKTLSSDFYQAGNYSFTFDASTLSSGNYFIQAEAGKFGVLTQKIVYLK